MQDRDELVEELRRDRRHRVVLVVAAVLGIITSTVFALAYSIGGAFAGAAGYRNPGALAVIVAPFATCMLVGYAIYRGLSWIAARPSQSATARRLDSSSKSSRSAHRDEPIE